MNKVTKIKIVRRGDSLYKLAVIRNLMQLSNTFQNYIQIFFIEATILAINKQSK